MRSIVPCIDAGLPSLGESVSRWDGQGFKVRALAWRPGRRAVFRVTGPGGSRIYKFYRKDGQIHRRWTALDRSPDGRWRVPRIHGWDPTTRLLTLEDCPGNTLHQRWMAGGATVDDGEWLTSVLDWLQRASVVNGLPLYRIENEVHLLERRLAHRRRCSGLPSERTERVLAEVIRGLRDDRVVDSVLCHRDLYDKQLLIRDGFAGGVLIDLDLVAAGPPAIDPGNVLAHVRLRALEGSDLPWREIARVVAHGTIEARGIADSLNRWTASALMRLALIYADRDCHPELPGSLLDSAEAALNRGGEWKRLL